jgi:hypothetical protein
MTLSELVLKNGYGDSSITDFALGKKLKEIREVYIWPVNHGKSDKRLYEYVCNTGLIDKYS